MISMHVSSVAMWALMLAMSFRIARTHRPRRRLACDWDGGETMDSKSTEAIKEKLDEALKILESGLAFCQHPPSSASAKP
jgi:hypothetical protein